MKNWIKYFLIAVLLWVVGDITTAFGFDFNKWFSYMPTIWLFYIGWPIIFTLIVFKLKIKGWKLFTAAMIGGIIVEIVFTKNALLYTFPIMFIAIPIFISLYSMITFLPIWIIEGKIKENKKWIITMIAIWSITTIIAIKNN